jgi:hypothetical protein
VISAAAIQAVPNTFGWYQMKPITIGTNAANRITKKLISMIFFIF